MVNIRASLEEVKSLRVFDALGNRVMGSAPYPGNAQTINLGQEPPGLYFIAITRKNGERQVEKIVLHR
ncbi:MAG: T9SS type A sorting domain-containing protein [Phaeodactylibacter sp.]|nr:T9SS type A sorting domain-containing protein [Phaeodactylibacter sp.]